MDRVNVSLDVARGDAASISLFNNKIWWVTGGFNGGWQRHKTTEMFRIEDGRIVGKVEEPPLLPSYYDSAGHCMARVDTNHVFIAGGTFSNAFLYDELSGNFTELPRLRCARSNAACTTVTIENTSMLMVIGGLCYSDESADFKVETLNMTQWEEGGASWEINTWLLGNIGSFYDGGYVTYGDSRGPVMLGSKEYAWNPNLDLSDKIFNFNSTTETFKMLPHQLHYHRHGHAVALIPDNEIKCG